MKEIERKRAKPYANVVTAVKVHTINLEGATSRRGTGISSEPFRKSLWPSNGKRLKVHQNPQTNKLI